MMKEYQWYYTINKNELETPTEPLQTFKSWKIVVTDVEGL